MTIKQMAEVAGVSPDTVSRKVKEMYPDRVKNGRPTNLVQSEAITVMSELRKKNFVSPLQNAEVARQNAEVGSILNERELAMIAKIVSVTVSETMKALDNRVTNIETSIEKRKALLPAPEIKPRDHINMIVREYAKRTGKDHREAWRELYRQFGYRTNSNPGLSAGNRDMTILDYIDAEGMIETLESVAMEIYK
jgi:hypothetical protein